MFALTTALVWRPYFVSLERATQVIDGDKGCKGPPSFVGKWVKTEERSLSFVGKGKNTFSNQEEKPTTCATRLLKS
jgi:hypothetical protein